MRKFITTYSIIGLFIMLILALASATIDSNKEEEKMKNENKEAKNVLGGKLQSCCTDPMTGYYRNGSCETGPSDRGTHVVCAKMTQEFLDYTKSKGNDLSTARPEYQFPGLKSGDQWCLCALRWQEAFEAGVAPAVILQSTEEKALKFIKLEDLKKHALKSE